MLLGKVQSAYQILDPSSKLVFLGYSDEDDWKMELYSYKGYCSSAKEVMIKSVGWYLLTDLNNPKFIATSYTYEEEDPIGLIDLVTISKCYEKLGKLRMPVNKKKAIEELS